MTQDNCQEEEVCFDKTFVPIARLESIRIMLAFTYCHDFVVNQVHSLIGS